MKKMVVGLLAMAIVLVGSHAYAVPGLYLWDSTDFVTVFDGDPDDANALAGVVGYNGAVGTDWIVNVTTGVTDPILAGEMDLNSINISATASAPSTLYIWFFDEQSFIPGSMLIGGTTDGELTFNALVHDGVSATTVGTLGPFGAGAFSGTAGVAGIAGVWNIMEVQITHEAGVGNTSFNAELKQVPEPGTILLLGSGLLGLGLMRRRKQD